MGESITNALPWLGQGGREESAASETTPGGEQPVRWVVIGVYNPGEAAIIKGRLESEDIPAVVQQEAVGSVLGLTVGPLGSARVLVPEPLVEQAAAILEQTFEVAGEGEEDEIE
jgi:hypothetical protein